MQFADAQLYGRTGRRCLTTVEDFAEGRSFRLNPKDVLFLKLFMPLLRENVPREIVAVEAQNAIIFTDACYEIARLAVWSRRCFLSQGLCSIFFSGNVC